MLQSSISLKDALSGGEAKVTVQRGAKTLQVVMKKVQPAAPGAADVAALALGRNVAPSSSSLPTADVGDGWGAPSSGGQPSADDDAVKRVEPEMVEDKQANFDVYVSNVTAEVFQGKGAGRRKAGGGQEGAAAGFSASDVPPELMDAVVGIKGGVVAAGSGAGLEGLREHEKKVEEAQREADETKPAPLPFAEMFCDREREEEEEEGKEVGEGGVVERRDADHYREQWAKMQALKAQRQEMSAPRAVPLPVPVGDGDGEGEKGRSRQIEAEASLDGAEADSRQETDVVESGSGDQGSSGSFVSAPVDDDRDREAAVARSEDEHVQAHPAGHAPVGCEEAEGGKASAKKSEEEVAADMHEVMYRRMMEAKKARRAALEAQNLTNQEAPSLGMDQDAPSRPAEIAAPESQESQGGVRREGERRAPVPFTAPVSREDVSSTAPVSRESASNAYIPGEATPPTDETASQEGASPFAAITAAEPLAPAESSGRVSRGPDADAGSAWRATGSDTEAIGVRLVLDLDFDQVQAKGEKFVSSLR